MDSIVYPMKNNQKEKEFDLKRSLKQNHDINNRADRLV